MHSRYVETIVNYKEPWQNVVCLFICQFTNAAATHPPNRRRIRGRDVSAFLTSALYMFGIIHMWLVHLTQCTNSSGNTNCLLCPLSTAHPQQYAQHQNPWKRGESAYDYIRRQPTITQVFQMHILWVENQIPKAHAIKLWDCTFNLQCPIVLQCCLFTMVRVNTDLLCNVATLWTLWQYWKDICPS